MGLLRGSFLLSLCFGGILGSLILQNVERSLDLSSQLGKMSHVITLENGGAAPVSDFLFTVAPKVQNKVAHVEATIGDNLDKTYLRILETTLPDRKGEKAWKMALVSPLSPGKTVKVDVNVVLAKCHEMYPSEISQREKQLVLFNENHYVYSPYKSLSQLTKITLPNSKIESYSKNLKPASSNDANVIYGPYSNVQPYSVDDLSIHYENNNPFLIVSRMERVLELSMWGNIAVEETFDVRHAGALLKGSFSRYEYQRENSGASSVKSFKTFLPASAVDVYYRDEVGNISTSAMKVLDEAVEINLQPRFPLFGGWKTHYVIGYNVPSYEYLYRKGDDFVLNMRLIDHVFNDMLVEDFTLKIILPEGVVPGKLRTPYPVHRQKDEKHYTYLDTDGRTVIVVQNVGDLVESHIQDFQLAFKFSKLTMLREPLLLIVAFFLFFLLAMVYVRLDFSISKDEGSEARMKVAGYCEKINNYQDKRNKSYHQFDEALVKLKSSKDTIAFQNTIKKINTDLKNETTNVATLNTTIKAVAPEMGEKISELQRLDKLFREHQTNQSLLVEKLVSGKLNKQQFIEQESVINKKKDECLEKINGIIRMF